ncbi:MAG: DEAD/DEAH box helicase [Anaerolineae bacterium]
MSDLRALLDTFRTAPKVAPYVTAWRVLEGRAAECAPAPEGLDPRLLAMLRARGIDALYTHQAEAVRHVLAGDSVVVVTPTASGKSLCYNLPVLNALLTEPDSCALYLFPTKALAHDQFQSLRLDAGALGLADAMHAYDGDTPVGRRSEMRRSARLLLTNPDMLHVSLLPNHTRWREFLGRLRYIIIDEMHTYRGVFGSHVANVLRRLLRICHFYGSYPQFICSSATIANPGELAAKLTGERVVVVAHNGAPRAERTFVFYNPPIMDAELGLRRSALLEARDLAMQFVSSRLQTIVFCRSRLATELLVTYLREDAQRLGLDTQSVRGYRGGYLPTERRAIEEGLRRGQVRAVAATNALELGIDIGGLAACIMAGYPGTIASTWQQAGRVGRGSESGSVAVLVASASALDQYIIAHPEFFFGGSPEHALINPDNLHILLGHIRCAAYELAFATDERYGGEDVQEVLAYLEEAGTLRRTAKAWHWTGGDHPAGEVSLRTADAGRVTIVEGDDKVARALGWLDRSSAPLFVHEGAVYLHEGQQYLVEALDWDNGVAQVHSANVGYYTEASRNTRIDIERVVFEEERARIHLAYGDVRLTTRVTGYRRLRLGSLEHLGWGEVDLPEQETVTSASWLTISEQVVDRLREEGWWVGEHTMSRGPSWPTQRNLARRRDGFRCRWCGAEERPGRQHDVHHIRPFRDFGWLPGENENHQQANALTNLITLCPNCHRRAEQDVAVQSTLSGLGRVLSNLMPLYLMCDPRDVSVQTDVLARQTGLPTLFVYDNIPAGVGLSEAFPSLFDELLRRGAELVRDCACEQGCPACIGPGQGNNARAKDQVLRLIAAIQQV